MNQETDEILVRRALAGDPQGFALLCERYYPALVATAHSVLMDGHMAEDIAQDAVAEACRRLRTLRKPERFGFWLGAICRNRARSAIRETRRRRKAAEGYVAPERDRVSEESAILAEAVASLPEHLRQVVRSYADSGGSSCRAQEDDAGSLH